MRVIYPGHQYELENIDEPSTCQRLNFLQRAPRHEPRPGVQNQEVLRVLIDRVVHLDSELPWRGNVDIIKHLRMALALHEARALVRKTEKGLYMPEQIITDLDGHFRLREKEGS